MFNFTCIKFKFINMLFLDGRMLDASGWTFSCRVVAQFVSHESRDILATLQSVGGSPFYRLRDGKTRRDYLFMPNYACIGLGHLPPESAAGVPEEQLVSLDGVNGAPEVEKTLMYSESEALTRLPLHLEQLFSEDASFSPAGDDPTPDSSCPQDNESMSSATLQSNPSNPLVPVELLMYNDLMGSRHLMDWNSSISTEETEHRTSSSG